MIIVKIYLGISLELCGQCGVSSVSDNSLFQIIHLKIYRPFPMQSVLNTGILICCTCHFQSGSLCLFGFFCLQVSSVSNFCSDTRGQRWSLVQAHLFSCAVGREEHCKQISLACVGECSQCFSHTGFAPTHGMCAFPVYTAQAPGCSAGSRPWVSCTCHV